MNLPPQTLRDRILDEVRATGGGIRRICDLFGLTVSGASRYTATLEHPDLANPPEPITAAGSRAPDCMA